MHLLSNGTKRFGPSLRNTSHNNEPPFTFRTIYDPFLPLTRSSCSTRACASPSPTTSHRISEGSSPLTPTSSRGPYPTPTTTRLTKPGLSKKSSFPTSPSPVTTVPKLGKTRKFFPVGDSSVSTVDFRFYLRKSHKSKKWIVFLEGGWYCYDNHSCRNRWLRQRHYMTSSQWPETRDGKTITLSL